MYLIYIYIYMFMPLPGDTASAYVRPSFLQAICRAAQSILMDQNRTPCGGEVWHGATSGVSRGTCTQNGLGGEVRHDVTSGDSCETSVNKRVTPQTSPPQGVQVESEGVNPRIRCFLTSVQNSSLPGSGPVLADRQFEYYNMLYYIIILHYSLLY